MTRGAWVAEDRATRRQLDEEAMAAAVTESEMWARAAAQNAQQMKEARQSETRNRRLSEPGQRPARR